MSVYKTSYNGKNMDNIGSGLLSHSFHGAENKSSKNVISSIQTRPGLTHPVEVGTQPSAPQFIVAGKFMILYDNGNLFTIFTHLGGASGAAGGIAASRGVVEGFVSQSGRMVDLNK